MEIESILRDIFGVNTIDISSENVKAGNGKSSKHEEAKMSQYLDWASKFIDETIVKNMPPENETDSRVGRIGPAQVRFYTGDHRQLVISPDRLNVYSVRHFCTLRANTGVYRGKWMYELQLGSKGLMQVGWSTIQCKFHSGCGVGDTATSYAYDGNNARKWNVTTQKYGEQWLAGDMIGCAIDTDDGTIDFYRNGRHLGRAFESINVGPGMAYFPTVSLAPTESLTANFGNLPIRYPIEGYQLLESPPVEEIAQATLVFKWFQKIIELLYEAKASKKRRSSIFDKSINIQTFLTSLAKYVLKPAGPLVSSPYITHQSFMPFLEELSETPEKSTASLSEAHFENAKLMICFDLLWAHLQSGEIKMCLENTIHSLLSIFKHLSLTLEYPDQRRILILLTKVCQHFTTRRYLLDSLLLFDEGRFAHFMYIKPLDQRNLVDVIPDVWWKTDPVDPAIEANKENYLNSCKIIEAAVAEVEALQVHFARVLLNKWDKDDKHKTSRNAFVKGFRRFVYDYLVPSERETSQRVLVPLPIALCCFQRLLVIITDLWFSEAGAAPIYVPCRTFYDESIHYTEIDRVGGILSHLRRTYKNDLIERLGLDHPVIRDINSANEVDSSISNRSLRQSTLGFFERLKRLSHTAGKSSQKSDESMDESRMLLVHLLDSIILMYQMGARKQLTKVASLEDDMLEYIADAAEATEWYKKVLGEAGSDLIQEELDRTMTFFKANLLVLGRYTAWAKAVILSLEKQTQLLWLMKGITLTVKRASRDGNMFRFVPEFYFQVLVDLSIRLRVNIRPSEGIEKIPGYREAFLDVAEFVCDHFLDPRIVHEDAKDTMTLTLAGLVSNSFSMELMKEIPPQTREKVVRNMLKLYDGLAWPPSNWILNKFWQGFGFAYRYKWSPHLSKKLEARLPRQKSFEEYSKSSPSLVYQVHVRNVLLSNPKATVKFIDSFLEKLNWTFSEFIGWIQEIHTISQRSGIFIDAGQMKPCAICFDLTVLLLRVLEMICTVVPEIFSISGGSANRDLLIRLFQLLCHVFSRIGSRTNCLQHVLSLEISELLSVDLFPILTAVIGILLVLLKDDMHTFTSNPTEVPPVTRILLSEPSFQINSLHFVLGEDKTDSTKPANSEPFSLLDYPEAVTEDEIKEVREMIKYLEECSTILPDPKTMNDSEEMCPICYAFPIEVTFYPCGHQTCRACIDRQLLNKRECFFCKGDIDQVKDLSGNMIHNFLHEAPE